MPSLLAMLGGRLGIQRADPALEFFEILAERVFVYRVGSVGHESVKHLHPAVRERAVGWWVQQVVNAPQGRFAERVRID